MNAQLERLFHSIRRGFMELPKQKDLEAIKKKIERIKKKDLVPLQKKLDEIMRSLAHLHGKPSPKKKRKPRKRR